MHDQPGPDAARPRLLVADDEKDLLEIFSEFLKDDFDLELASTGTDAIEKLRSRPRDVVVTDINMPGADGLAVLRAAKEANPETEVIVLTGNASTLTAIEALREGAYDYILKPFDLYEMDQVLRKALERRRLLDENRRFVATLQQANEDLRQSQEELRRHRDELRERVEAATRRIRTLYEVGQEISSSLDLDRTLGLVLDRSMALTGAAAGALFLPADGTAEFRCRVRRGLEELAGGAERPGELEAMLGRAVAQRRPEAGLLEGPGGPPRHALVVPFLRDGEVRGLVAVVSPGPRPFSEDDAELLSGLGAQGSIAIHNAVVYEKIRELERLKSEFVAVVSHELRTPLTAIKGTVELLADERYFERSPRQGELFEICQANAERLEALVNDILDLSKLESSRLSSHFVESSLPVLVRTALVNIGRVAEQKGIVVTCACAEPLPVVRADEMRIVQVINNLVANAVKFSNAGTSIQVEVAEEAGGVRVSIRDQGIGIAPEDLPKLFHRFRQLDSSSTREAGGTGLGLVISKGIVEEHGGRIWAESTPGAGSTFHFWLPAGASAPVAAIASCDRASATGSREPASAAVSRERPPAAGSCTQVSATGSCAQASAAVSRDRVSETDSADRAAAAPSASPGRRDTAGESTG